LNRVLVVGATGTVGREVVSQLSTAGVRVRALTRKPEATRFPPRVEVVCGDLAVPESLERCLDGVDTVFQVWTAPPDAVAPAVERIAKYARRVVFLCSPHKTPHPFFQQPNPWPCYRHKSSGLSRRWDLTGHFCGRDFFGKFRDMVGAADSRGRRRALAACRCSHCADPRI
jgi:hypothetical protein